MMDKPATVYRAKNTFKDFDGVVIFEGQILGELVECGYSPRRRIRFHNTVMDGRVTAVLSFQIKFIEPVPVEAHPTRQMQHFAA